MGGDSQALFARDRDAPSLVEFNRCLRWLGYSRRTLLGLVENLAREVLDRETSEDAHKEFHEARRPSIRGLRSKFPSLRVFPSMRPAGMKLRFLTVELR